MLTPVQRELKRKYIKYLNATESVDKNMIVDCITNYMTPEIDFTDKVCLDLGGNVGGFTKVAIDGGAKAVYTVECDIRNYEKMAESFADEPKANIIHAAVSDSTAPSIRIYKGNSQQAHCSVSIMKRSKFTDYDEVINIHISELLKKYQPDIIKIDIEGADFDALHSISFETLEPNRFPEYLLLETAPPVSNSLAFPAVKLAQSVGYIPELILPMATLLIAPDVI